MAGFLFGKVQEIQEYIQLIQEIRELPGHTLAEALPDIQEGHSPDISSQKCR